MKIYYWNYSIWSWLNAERHDRHGVLLFHDVKPEAVIIGHVIYPFVVDKKHYRLEPYMNLNEHARPLSTDVIC